jgi:pantoate--beta-alanine ligase
MKIIEKRDDVIDFLSKVRNGDLNAVNVSKIGFVPTMGALHAGHVSLVERCCKECDFSVVSIFVNPTQFNNKTDLANYPRTIESDLSMLSSTGCDVVFVPSVSEIYPDNDNDNDNDNYDFGLLDKVMEGVHRPGHFNGVAQVVGRLFDIVCPDFAYFGEKDFQQLAIVRRLVEICGYAISIVGCPTIRQSDGLAMSSRNALLSDESRTKAAVISRILFDCKRLIHTTSIENLKFWVFKEIDTFPNMKIEYFDVVDRINLQSASVYRADSLQACIAVVVDSIRLIDNVEL